MGNLLGIVVHAANIHDTKSGILAAQKACKKYPSIQAFCADAGYRGTCIDEVKVTPHNSAARLAMSFPPSAACKFLDLHPVNLRNLHLHLTKNPFASRPPHLCGVTLTVSHITGVTPRSAKNVNMFMSESLVDYKICHVGDLAANTMWMWQGAIGVSNYEEVISPSYNTYRQRTHAYYSGYLEYLLRVPVLVSTYAAYSTGITVSRLRLYPDQFFSIVFPVPSNDEQKEVATHLDTKCAEIDRLIAAKQQLLTELESYKKSVIYEYVTGKKEVI